MAAPCAPRLSESRWAQNHRPQAEPGIGVHFAFFDACHSSPRWRVYTRDGIEDELEQATREHWAETVSFPEGGGQPRVPAIFRWYPEDFGSDADILGLIARYLETDKPQEIRTAMEQDVHLAYQGFDWSLAGSPLPPRD